MSARASKTASNPTQAQKRAGSKLKPKLEAAASRMLGVSALPTRRNYAPRLEQASLLDLPFCQLDDSGESLQCWSPAKVKNYGEACLLGAEYAAHWLQFVKDGGSGHYVYTLGRIVRDMDFADSSQAKGCIVGFFAHIERVLRGSVQCFDVYQDLDLATAHLRPEREPAMEGGRRGHTT